MNSIMAFPFIIIFLAILAVQLVVNIIFIFWFRGIYDDFIKKVHMWIKEASDDIAKDLRNEQAAAYATFQNEAFLKMVNMLEHHVKNLKVDSISRDRAKESRGSDRLSFITGFEVRDAKSYSGYDFPLVHLITPGNRNQSVVPAVYVDYDKDITQTCDENEKLIGTLQCGYSKFDCHRPIYDQGKPALFLFKHDIECNAGSKNYFSFIGVLMYRINGSGKIRTEYLASNMSSDDADCIFDGPRISFSYKEFATSTRRNNNYFYSVGDREIDAKSKVVPALMDAETRIRHILRV